jgi:cytochrome c oxidase subunit II
MSHRNRFTLYLLLGLLALAGCQSQTPGRRVTVSMRKFAIAPPEIRLKAGETVQFEVLTQDVQHGFEVPDLGISEPVNPGRPAIFTYRADRKGSFKVECGILCGPGHEDMKATIIVE